MTQKKLQIHKMDAKKSTIHKSRNKFRVLGCLVSMTVKYDGMVLVVALVIGVRPRACS